MMPIAYHTGWQYEPKSKVISALNDPLGKKCKGVYSCLWKSVSQLRGVTCHMGSHSVTYYPTVTQANTPRLHLSQGGADLRFLSPRLQLLDYTAMGGVHRVVCLFIPQLLNPPIHGDGQAELTFLAGYIIPR